MASSLSPPKSSSKFLMRMERSATGRATDMVAPSEVVILTIPGAVASAVEAMVWIAYEVRIRWGEQLRRQQLSAAANEVGLGGVSFRRRGYKRRRRHTGCL